MRSSYLTNQFLIAMPQLADPNFFHTVTYICAHNNEGAMGILINRPLDLDLGDILTQMDLEPSVKEIGTQAVYHGGPVHTDRGFVIHKPEHKWQSSIHVCDDIDVTTSRDILEAMAEGEGPEQALVALGYAGWAAGQLEQEIKDNAWLNSPANNDIIFTTPDEQRWSSAANLLGIDLNNLSSDIGHA